MAEATQAQPWFRGRTEFFLVFLATAILAVLYAPVITRLFDQLWTDSNYRHGILVPIISGVILYVRRDELRAVPRRSGNLFGLLIVMGGCGLLLVGTAATEFFTMRASLPTILFGLSLFLFGSQFTKKTAFPLLFLFMMVPLPYIIYYKVAFPLQLLSAKISASVLDLIGVNLIRRGNVLMLPNYALEVVAACSGLRSLMTMFTLSLVIGAFTDLSTRNRFILVLFAVPAALTANVIRLIVTAIGAYMVSTSFADGFLHDFSGILVFISGFLFLLITFFVLRRFQ